MRLVFADGGIRRLLKALDTHRVFSLDTETTSEVALSAELEIISISVGDDDFVIPFYACVDRQKALRAKAAKTRQQHFTPDPMWKAKFLDVKPTLELLRPYLEDRKWLKPMHNAKFDMEVLGNYGVRCRNVWDTMIAGFLVDENKLKTLKVRCKDVGMRLQDYKTTMRALKDGGLLEDYFKYAHGDSRATLKLYWKYREDMRAENVHEVFIKQENRMTHILCDMERRGIMIDVPFVKKIDKQVKCVLAESRAKIYKAAGKEVNLNSVPQLRDLLYRKLGLTSSFATPKGEPGTNVDALKEMAYGQGSKVARELLRYRELAKLDSQYTDPARGVMKHIAKDGRIHPSFGSVTAITGRFGCSKPNLQNIPRSNDESFHIRRAFIAAPGKTLVVADYSQIELRLLAHYSRDPIMMRAYQNREDLHQVTADALHVDRALAKNLNFGTVYGIGAAKFARMAGITEDNARNAIRAFFKLYAMIDVLKARINRIHRKQGYIKLMTGRKRRVEGMDSTDPYEASSAERQTINSLIQGSAADLMKVAMIRLYESRDLKDLECRMLLQVHDEIVFECPENYAESAKQVIDRLMCLPPDGVELRVPLESSIGIGKSWEGAKS